MNIKALDIDGIFLVTPKRFADDRGYFSEVFKAHVFNEAIGKTIDFVQDNHSYSQKRGTVRGLHFQSPPHAQGKLVRCPRGSIVDIAIDVRKGSDTYGQHVRVELSEKNGQQLWVPAGFLHGFVTLEDDTEVTYKVTDYYAPECDGNVFWNDADLGLDWGIDPADAVLSEKDKKAPKFRDFQTPF